MTFDELVANNNKLKLDIAKIEGIVNANQTQINNLEEAIKKTEAKIIDTEKCIQVLNAASQKSREGAKKHFENIVTSALQFATQSQDYKFIIEECKGRKASSYEFYVESSVNGETCLQKPEDANGGGFVDIISVALKYAYLQIFSDPVIMSGTLFYDEPGKMISADMSVKFAEYLKYIGVQSSRQTIMVTHNDAIATLADKAFIVIKDGNGVSNVKQELAFDEKAVMKEVQNELEKH